MAVAKYCKGDGPEDKDEFNRSGKALIADNEVTPNLKLSHTPEGCAQLCDGLTFMFLQGREECHCQKAANEDGECHEMVENLDVFNKPNAEFILYKILPED